MKRTIAILTAALAVSVWAGSVRAGGKDGYEAVAALKESGTIRGVVRFEGTVPAEASMKVDKDKDVCGAAHTADDYKIKNGKLAETVAYLADVKKGLAPDAARTAKLDQEKCRYLPHVQTMSVGQSLSVNNSDPVLHNVHAYQNGKAIFNLAMPVKDREMKRTVKQAGLVELKCDAGHAWMLAYIHVFPHPYHAVSAEDGTFEIKNVPPGDYTLAFHHPKLGEKKAKVSVKNGKTETVEVVFKGK